MPVVMIPEIERSCGEISMRNLKCISSSRKSMQPEKQQMQGLKNRSKDMLILKFMPLQEVTCLQPFLANTIDK